VRCRLLVLLLLEDDAHNGTGDNDDGDDRDH
jgi:hypothetical protein